MDFKVKKTGKILYFYIGEDIVSYDMQNYETKLNGKISKLSKYKDFIVRNGISQRSEDSDEIYAKFIDYIIESNGVYEMKLLKIIKEVKNHSYAEKYLAQGFDITRKFPNEFYQLLGKLNKTILRFMGKNHFNLNSIDSIENVLRLSEIQHFISILIEKDSYVAISLLEENSAHDTLKSFETIKILNGKYGYPFNSIADYLIKAKVNQQLDPNDTVKCLLKYIELQYDYYSHNKNAIDRYPSNLLTQLHIASKYGEATKLDISKQDLSSFHYSDDKYSVVSPVTADDIVIESKKLRHCGATYIKIIKKGLCKLLFVRLNREIDRPLLTMEVRDNAIVQVKGKCNRKVSSSELKFIIKFAEEKKLKLFSDFINPFLWAYQDNSDIKNRVIALIKK